MEPQTSSSPSAAIIAALLLIGGVVFVNASPGDEVAQVSNPGYTVPVSGQSGVQIGAVVLPISPGVSEVFQVSTNGSARTLTAAPQNGGAPVLFQLNRNGRSFKEIGSYFVVAEVQRQRAIFWAYQKDLSGPLIPASVAVSAGSIKGTVTVTLPGYGQVPFIVTIKKGSNGTGRVEARPVSGASARAVLSGQLLPECNCALLTAGPAVYVVRVGAAGPSSPDVPVLSAPFSVDRGDLLITPYTNSAFVAGYP